MEIIGEFSKLIFGSPSVSLPMFYKSVKLISHDPVDLMQVLFKHGSRYSSSCILKYFRLVGSSTSLTTQTPPDPDDPLSERVPAKAGNPEVKQSKG